MSQTDEVGFAYGSGHANKKPSGTPSKAASDAKRLAENALPRAGNGNVVAS